MPPKRPDALVAGRRSHRAIPEFCRDRSVTLVPEEVQLAQKLIEGLAHSFEPSQYRDEYQLRLQQMIEAKRQLQPIEITQPPRRAPVIDLMTALRQSLGQLLTAKASPVTVGRTAPQEQPPRRLDDSSCLPPALTSGAPAAAMSAPQRAPVFSK